MIVKSWSRCTTIKTFGYMEKYSAASLHFSNKFSKSGNFTVFPTYLAVN